MLERIRNFFWFPIILFEVFAIEFYWIGKFFGRVATKVWHGAPMNNQTIDEADREITGEKQRRERWRERQSEEKMREADAILQQFTNPRHWAWSMKNVYAKRGIELDLEEMVEIISPLGGVYAPSEEQHEKLLDYVDRKVEEASKREPVSP